jgi:hypothetical protein
VRPRLPRGPNLLDRCVRLSERTNGLQRRVREPRIRPA